MRLKTVIFRIFLLFILVISGLFPKALPSEKRSEHRLNVLLITIDTLRPDRLSCYGSERLKTPNVDKLASRGVLFTRAFANTSTTLPSHTNIMLGTTPSYHGVHANSDFVVGDEQLTLAELLKSNGYETGAFVGGWPLDSQFGLTQGFETYDSDFGQSSEALERSAEEVVNKALDWIKTKKSPWFLWIHCFDPHDPYEPPDPYMKKFAGDLYSGEVAYVDDALGNLMDYMNAENLFDNTLTLFTGDHGESLGEHSEETHGFLAYNSTIWVPLIVVFPSAEARDFNGYVSHVDIFPTICDILEIEKPDVLQGSSLLPALKGKKMKKMPIYFESLYPFYSLGWAPLRGYILDREKYIDSPIPELYDLEKDFDELKNLAEEKNSDKHRKKLKELIQDQSSPEIKRKQQILDRTSREKLASLGYVSFGLESMKKEFGPKDDVKMALPFSNKANEAVELFEKGERRKAIEMTKEILTERQNIPNAYSNLANFYKKMGRLSDSIEVLKIGLSNIPSSYTIFFNLINNLAEARQYDTIMTFMKEYSFRQANQDPALWNILGNVYYAKLDLQKAEENYQRALALDERNSLLLTNLGNLKLTTLKTAITSEDLKNALELFKQAIEYEPEYVEAYIGLGRAYLQANQTNKSIQVLEKAYELDPDSDDALFYLGSSYLENNRKTEALRLFNMLKERSYDRLPAGFRKRLDASIQEAQKK
jgi:arylsulfatase A-like enzyme/Tfp pilus assembly protein PilF